MKRGRIYKIVNELFPEEFYINSTTIPISKVWKLHKKTRDNTDISLRMQDQPDNWKILILEDSIPCELLMEKLLYWIRLYPPMLTGEIVEAEEYFMQEGPIDTGQSTGWLSYFSIPSL